MRLPWQTRRLRLPPGRPALRRLFRARAASPRLLSGPLSSSGDHRVLRGERNGMENVVATSRNYAEPEVGPRILATSLAH